MPEKSAEYAALFRPHLRLFKDLPVMISGSVHYSWNAALPVFDEESDIMMPTHKITELLQAWNKGDAAALDELMGLVDHELRNIAHAYMLEEKSGHTLQTTALVNEALLRLLGKEITWTDRKQFYSLVAKRMRQVLIDHARGQLAEKRGRGAEHVDVSDAVLRVPEKSRELIMLDEALTKLAKVDERKAQIVEYRYFVGLTREDVAEILGISPSTVEREWRFARSWLKHEMTGN